MPSARVSVRAATISTRPRAIEKTPRPRARASVWESGWPGRPVRSVSKRMGVASTVLGIAACSRRARWRFGLPWSRRSRLGVQHPLDAAVLLVAKGLVHRGTAIERDSLRDDEGRVDLALLDAAQEVVGPAAHMRLAH